MSVAYKDRTHEELKQELASAQAAYEALKAQNLKLNMARGKPGKEQLDLVSDLLTILHSPEQCMCDGMDVRNYGELSGLPSAKRLFADILGCKPEECFIGGSASLTLMYDAVSKAVTHGTEKKGTVLTDMEKRIVSYHEVGHALVAALQKHTQPVSKITIVPHTSGALGYTMQTPEEEKYLSSREELIVELQTLLGGRAAEQIVFGIATTGASNDIERATELARKMVTQYGMSEKFGLMALSTVSNQYLDGSTMMNCADETAYAADSEIQKLLESCYEQAKAILRAHRELLDEVALYLLQKETITGDELMTYVNAEGKRLQAPEQPEDRAADAPAPDAPDSEDSAADAPTQDV